MLQIKNEDYSRTSAIEGTGLGMSVVAGAKDNDADTENISGNATFEVLRLYIK